MSERLLKVAKYLGSQGLYEEAAQLQKLAQAQVYPNNGSFEGAEDWMQTANKAYEKELPYKYIRYLESIGADFYNAANSEPGTHFLHNTEKFPQYKEWNQDEFLTASELIGAKIKELEYKEIEEIEKRLENAEENLMQLRQNPEYNIMDYNSDVEHAKTLVRSLRNELRIKMENMLSDEE